MKKSSEGLNTGGVIKSLVCDSGVQIFSIIIPAGLNGNKETVFEYCLDIFSSKYVWMKLATGSSKNVVRRKYKESRQAAERLPLESFYFKCTGCKIMKYEVH